MELILGRRSTYGRILFVLSFLHEQPTNQDTSLSAKFPRDTGRLFLRIVVKPSGSSRCADLEKRRSSFMKAKEFDKKFDAGKGILKDLDLEKAIRPGQEQKRVNVDFPAWMVARLDKEARRLGVPRQSLIKIWIAEKLQGL